MKTIAVTVLLLLMGLIFYEWFSWPERYKLAVAVTAADGKSERESVENSDYPLFQQPHQAYRTIADQTLFRSDRQGFQRQDGDQLARHSRPAVPKFRLLGVVLTESEPPSAKILEEKSHKSRTLHIGDELGSWRVEGIHADYLLLRWEDQQETIQLRKF
jgi:hypothetical protein